MINTREPNQILALIPANNEAMHISSVVRRAGQYLPVLVVDDGSIDQTAALAAQAGAEVFSQSPNQGKGKALMAGFRLAVEKGYDGIITLDGDEQHDPDEIPLFIDAFRANQPDLVIGKRDFSKMPPVRRVSNTLGRYMLSWALGQSIPDNQSGYRLVSRRLAQDTLTSQESGFEFEVEMVIRCIRMGYTLDWVPISTIYADEKSHISPLKHVVNYFRITLQALKK
jgi:glycosyltransferase involved in cell wall biosynthesis